MALALLWPTDMRWADGFIAVDWGTTNRRAYRIDSSGACGDEFEDAKGALSVPAGEFPAAAAEIRQRLGDLPLLLGGMAGSNRGWVEAPYVPCPGGIDELVDNLVWADERAAIVPGLCNSATDAPTSCAARKSSCSAPWRTEPCRPTPWSAIPAPTTNGWWSSRAGSRVSEPS